MYITLFFAALLTFAVAQDIAESSAQNATAFALVYGYPLLAFSKLASVLVPIFGTNNFYNQRELSTSTERVVVKPNVDTIYTTTIFDLSQNDVALTIPEIPSSQFALFSFYDPYGVNFANLGTENIDQPGQYLIRNRGDKPYGAQKSSDPESQYVAHVNSPSTFGIILVRLLVNATNLDAVHGYQDGITLKDAGSSSGTGPPLTLLDYRTSLLASPAQNVLDLLAQLAAYDQPETKAEAKEVGAILKTAGISKGHYSPPSNVDLNSANKTALADIAAAAAKKSNSVTLNNGWSITSPAAGGNFNNGSNYAFRAAVASSGYLMIQAPNAVYPSYSNNSNSGSTVGSAQYDLAEDESYIYTFSGKPPLRDTGFWSLTAYQNNYLIPNSQNVYEAGDRSNLTYPDGTRVYGSKDTRRDGAFQVLIQASSNPPPANWTSNWIPGPSGGGEMTAVLRWYDAEEALLDGTYQYPTVTKQKAITSGKGGSKSSATGILPPLTSLL